MRASPCEHLNEDGNFETEVFTDKNGIFDRDHRFLLLNSSLDIQAQLNIIHTSYTVQRINLIKNPYTEFKTGFVHARMAQEPLGVVLI